jgi:GR25 family glycosyltransferase involved in LPS biosynthesis
MPDIKYYCLHHTPLEDRKKFLEERFLTLNLDVEWVTGFSPENITLPSGSHFQNIGEYSLYLKHQYCFEQQITNNFKYVVIIEDDALLPDNFNTLLKESLIEFELLQGDLLFLGICCDIKPSSITPTKRVYWEPHFLTRCTHCYVTTLSAANIILKHFSSNQIATDYKINDIIRLENLKSCYCEPGIHQGSHGGKFKGSLQNQ